jgi:hypothetical protein
MGNGLAGEMRRRKSNKEALLERLLDGKEHTQAECQEAGGLRYGARMLELRDDGYVIEKRHTGGGGWVFWMPSPRRVDPARRPVMVEADGQLLLF